MAWICVGTWTQGYDQCATSDLHICMWNLVSGNKAQFASSPKKQMSTYSWLTKVQYLPRYRETNSHNFLLPSGTVLNLVHPWTAVRALRQAHHMPTKFSMPMPMAMPMGMACGHAAHEQHRVRLYHWYFLYSSTFKIYMVYSVYGGTKFSTGIFNQNIGTRFVLV
jgi:hypothetical protein